VQDQLKLGGLHLATAAEIRESLKHRDRHVPTKALRQFARKQA
jgi:hypothetical protein